MHPTTRRAAAVSILLLLLGVLAAPAARAQAPAWQTVTALQGLSTAVTATATGPGGFVFMVGSFSGTAAFGATQLTSAGSTDVFVAKWDPGTRTFVWAQRAGGNAADEATGVAVQGANVYVTGNFSSPTAAFGPATLPNANTAATGPTADAFLTKLVDAGSTGSFGWTQRFGGGHEELSTGVAVVGSSVYVCGQFRSATVAFGSTTLVNEGIYNVFVAKLTDAGATGSFVWARQAGGTETDGVGGLAVSGSSVYIGGYFYSPTATFGPFTLINSVATRTDGFVAKLADAGASADFAWVLPITGDYDDYVTSLKASGNNVYLSGSFNSPIVTIGGSALGNASSRISTDSFVAKATDAGATSSFVWARQAGGASDDVFSALALNGQSIYLAGSFKGNAQFGSTTLASQGDADICVVKLTDAGTTGSFVWAQQAGGSGRDRGLAIAFAGTSMCLVGSVEGMGTATFGPLALPNSLKQPLGFVATLTDPTLTATTGPRPAPAFDLVPNPAHCTVAVQLPATTGPATPTLRDGLGRTVRTATLPATSPRHQLDLAGLPAGLYVVQVATGAATTTRRLTVE